MIERSGDRALLQRTLEQDGFGILPDVLSAGEVSLLVNELSGLAHQGGRAGIRHLLKQPAVTSLANDQRLLGIARQVLGDAAFPFKATLFDKSLSSNWLITWHQDTALPVREKREVEGWSSWSKKEGVTYAHAPANALERILALRVHLDESTIENGPLRVLLGSHRMGVLSDDAILDLTKSHAAVSCLVPRGGILAMRPLLIHASSKSLHHLSRRVLHLEYASASAFPGGLQMAIA